MATWTAWHPDRGHGANVRHGHSRRVLTLVVLLVAVRASTGNAEGPPTQLVLPLLATLAMGRSVYELHVRETSAHAFGFARGDLPAKPTFIPSFLTIPDLYAVDATDRDPKRFAAPVDRNKMLSLNLLPRSLSVDRSLSVVYDTENVPALRDSSRLLRLEFEVDF
ncbi:MAG TPA: hypothetical protein VJ829_15770 [Candidatus Binatia bacterium]|nr:hypothetical protein [Candidatus Binatia bacterium]